MRIAGLLVAALLLAACGDGSSPERAVPMRSVTDASGKVLTVPVEPLRVAALGPAVVDGVRALGLTPVDPADRPDLVIYDGTDAAALTQLPGTAPAYDAGAAGRRWRTSFRFVAQALNKGVAGRAVLKQYDDAVRSAKHDLNAYSATSFAIVSWEAGRTVPIPAGLPVHRVFDELGLQLTEEDDADYLFLAAADPTAALAAARALPGFDDLTAMREDHVVGVDASRWTVDGGPLLMQALVSDVVAALA